MAQNFIFEPKMLKNGKVKNFCSKFFWSESSQNVLKRILKRKSRNRKFCSSKIFSLVLSRFVAKMIKNDKVEKFWSNMFLIGIDSECFKT